VWTGLVGSGPRRSPKHPKPPIPKPQSPFDKNIYFNNFNI